MSTLDPYTIGFWIDIAVAIACSGVIGLERQIRGKPAGIRTSMLVCLGTLVFVALGANVDGEHADPTRVLGQTVTGIGFLGAGVIMAREGIVKGMTSAAVIWVLAGIGAAIALERLPMAVAITIVVLIVLVGIDVLESSVRRLRRGVHADDDAA